LPGTKEKKEDNQKQKGDLCQSDDGLSTPPPNKITVCLPLCS
jgi:hypothetical protein